MDIEKIRENLLNGTVQGYLTINNVEYVLVNKVHYSEALAELDSVAPDSIQPEPPALSEVEGGEFTKKYTEKEILLSYEGRCICDKQELGGGYCGSCSIEIHREQLNNPKSWVHSSMQHWLEAVNPKPTYEQLQAEIDRLEARNRVKQGLLEVTENMLNKERAEKKQQAERIGKLEKELKNNKPQIEDDMC